MNEERSYPDFDDSSSAELALLLSSNMKELQSSLSIKPLICRPHRLWQRIKLCRHSRKISWRYLCIMLCFLVSFFTVYLTLYSSSSSHFIQSFMRKPPSISVFHCKNNAIFLPHDHSFPVGNASASGGKLRDEPKVLLFTETQHSKHGKAIAEILVANRIKYKTEVIGKSLPLLTDLSKGKYGAIIFENFERYLAMDQWNRELLDKYLIEYRVGIVGFFPQNGPYKTYVKLHNFPLYLTSSHSLTKNPVLRITRPGDTINDILQGYNWSLFLPDHPTYLPLEWADDLALQIGSGSRQIFSVLDKGQYDKIRRILFGGGVQFWLHRLLLLDALSYLSYGRISVSLRRYILVDIDDIFVGPKGNRITPDDVQAMLDSQERLKKSVPGFQFNLGFSGKFFQKGSSLENEGDRLLLKYVDKFWWFGHMWGHTQPHKVETVDQLMMLMEKNKEFAVKHGIPTDSGYSVAPHHSGVYPVHEALYEAWKEVWKIRVTSSEEYPHLRPSRLRRGFIHRNIMILPRQTCGLYTHTNYFDKYPGGKVVLDSSINGGELFQTIVFNPINIFMTHQNNYAHDRLALYTFESVVKFLKCWTNFAAHNGSSAPAGGEIFSFIPSRSGPYMGDKRHTEIWSPNKTCNQLPRFLVIGPQKTGTTALYTFLAMHPAILANNPSPETYMKFFPVPGNASSKFLFEKSATYFDGELVPKRVAIIIPPEKRAYSWYHHMRAHNDATSLTYSFYQVISATSKSPRTLKDLKNKCLNPGMYAKHLERWLSYFPAPQVSIIDGEELRNDPVTVMNNLQKFLTIEPFYNYTEHLSEKDFTVSDHLRIKLNVLEGEKGVLSSMKENEEKFLKEYLLLLLLPLKNYYYYYYYLNLLNCKMVKLY
ncbi:Bifunctional heparan sulfate N-deacetylase/N-sulfotransferase [Armadillidium vulgare]|nr:Bifunctional heparan sulfate N-deacetylase/N-sulfotransferase [Armadillidium vulgare]